MKILLIQPPIRDFYHTSIRTQPIGLAYLAASLQAQGHEAEVLDCQKETKRSVPIPAELSYLKDLYPFDDRSPFKLYSGYYHFGMGWEEIRRKIEESKADLFGISSNFTPYHGEALEVARMVKGSDRRRIVVMGGAHVSCDPEGVLRNPFVDYVVMGEGEVRLPLLLKRLQRGETPRDIDGIGYRVNGEIRLNPLQTFIQDLDSLPYPSRQMLDLDRYRIGKKRSTMIMTSRGCPHGCVYCSTHLVMGTSFRTRSPDAIIQEMTECRDQYDIRVFDIEDDNFTFDRERAKRLMRLIIETFGQENIELTAMNGVSFASLDEELLRLMKEAGFKTINLSFVSADPSVKMMMHRPAAPHDFHEVLVMAERIGLNVIAYAIFGMPGQTLKEMVETLIYLMEKRVLIGPSIYYPTPGTPLFEKCRKDGVLPSYASQWRSSALPIETDQFNRLDLLTLLRLVRVINFIKGKMDKKELSEGMTWKALDHLLRDRDRGQGKDESVAWMDPLSFLLRKKTFFSLKKDFKGKRSILKEVTSRKVLDAFFERAWEGPILKSRNA